jgi:hypothetical protein
VRHPSAEDFDAWRENPVTQWVMKACELAGDDNRRNVADAMWGSGVADQKHLTENRARADAYYALCDTNYEGWKATHELDR